MDLSGLNDRQKEAVLADDKPLLILAGAGSGKTRVLSYRIAYLIERGISPEHILAVTFTNKAAKEMKERVHNLVGKEARKIWAGTFHGVAVRMLRKHAGRLGYKANWTIFDDTDTKKLIARLMAQEFPTVVIDHGTVADIISNLKSSLVGPEEFALNAEEGNQVVAQVYARYQQELMASNAMDFDDLINNVVQLLETDAEIRARYQKQFSHVLIDEYQDINHAQYRMVRLIVGDANRIFVVGDDFQSIYAFRGADIRNILSFEQDFTEHQVVKLEQNYRSTKTIIAAANSVIENNSTQMRKSLWTENDQGEKILDKLCFTEFDESRYVVGEIMRHIKAGRSPKDIAILYRMNSQSRLLEEQLLGNRVKYEIIGGLTFYQRREIKDVMAYMRLLHNPQDGISLHRIINVPRRGIGNTTVGRLEAYAKEHHISMSEALEQVKDQDVGKAVARVQEFANLMKKFREAREQLPLDLLMSTVVNQSGLLEALEAEEEGKSRVGNVRELIKMTSERLLAEPEMNLETFLAEVALLTDIDQSSGEDCVKMMTVHSAKGLEFPVVFVVGMEEGLFPHAKSEENEEIEEERRLFYVAVTRAKEKLYLTHCRTRSIWGRAPTEPQASRFLSEINDDLKVFERGIT